MSAIDESDDDYAPWEVCWDCDGSGYTHHDCGEDTCCCLHPEDNVVCDTCEGCGGWPVTEPTPDPSPPHTAPPREPTK